MATPYVLAGAHVKGRNPFAVLGLSIITLGIYWFVWWYKVNREMRDASQRRVLVDPTMSLLAVTIGALVVVPALVSIHKTARRSQELARLAGRTDYTNMWLYWLLYLFTGIGSSIYLQWELNKTWSTMSSGGTVAASLGMPDAASPEAASSHPGSGPFV
jgi:ABC-type Fe3+-siderophore transport system permease subunit